MKIRVLLSNEDLACTRACHRGKRLTRARVQVADDYLCGDCAYDISCELRVAVHTAERIQRRNRQRAEMAATAHRIY